MPHLQRPGYRMSEVLKVCSRRPAVVQTCGRSKRDAERARAIATPSRPLYVKSKVVQHQNSHYQALLSPIGKRFGIHTAHCPVYIIHRSLYNIQCEVCVYTVDVQCILYTARYTLFTVHSIMHNVHCKLSVYKYS